MSQDTQDNGNSHPALSTRTLGEIFKYSTEELSSLESTLSAEFKELGKKYISARLERVESLIEQINSSIKKTSSSDKSWLKIYNFELETINNIKTNTEDLVLINQGLIPIKPDILKSFDEYEEELKEIFKNLQSPLSFDETLSETPQEETNPQLPFPYLFDQFFKSHKQTLRAISNEKDYQSRLIQSSSKGNSTIIWKRYFHNLVQKRQHLIRQTYDELNQLYKEYNNINEEEVSKKSWNHYYKSLYSVNDMKKVHDDNGQLLNTANTDDLASILTNNRDSTYVHPDNNIASNKIELSSIRRDIIERSKRYLESQDPEGQADSKRIRLHGLSGLGNSEIDNDILSLRKAIQNKGVVEESSEIDVSVKAEVGENEQSLDGEEEDEDKDDDNLEDNEIDQAEAQEISDEQHAEQEEELQKLNEENELKIKYQQLLGLNKPAYLRPYSFNTYSTPFVYPALPPLDSFQH